MRVAPIRSDLGHLYLDDVENASQRNFSSQAPGQSRYFHKPSDAELLGPLNQFGLVTIQGTATGTTADTSGANAAKLNIRASSTAAFSQVVVTAGTGVTKAQLASDLNSGFASAGLPLAARVGSANQITIDTSAGGPAAYVEITASGPAGAGAFQTAAGLSVGSKAGIPLSSLKAVTYPTATSVNVSATAINGISGSTFTLLSAAQQTALDNAVANVVAPSLVETGSVLLSFVYGKLAKLRSPNFIPGSPQAATESRLGYATGAAVAIVANDGSTPFTV
jgi:hypothetical protein